MDNERDILKALKIGKVELKKDWLDSENGFLDLIEAREKVLLEHKRGYWKRWKKGVESTAPQVRLGAVKKILEIILPAFATDERIKKWVAENENLKGVKSTLSPRVLIQFFREFPTNDQITISYPWSHPATVLLLLPGVREKSIQALEDFLREEKLLE